MEPLEWLIGLLTLTSTRSYDENIEEYIAFLEKGKKEFFTELKSRKDCSGFKIKKVYGKLKDIKYDNRNAVIFYDKQFSVIDNDIEHFKTFMNGNPISASDVTKARSNFKDYLSNISLFDDDEEIMKRVRNIFRDNNPDKLSKLLEDGQHVQHQLRDVICNGDYAILKHMGEPRLDLGQSVSHNGQHYTVISANLDGTYDLQNMNDGKSVVFCVSGKSIVNYANLVRLDAEIQGKRILFKYDNGKWVSIRQNDIPANICQLNKSLMENVFSMDFGKLIESEDHINKICNDIDNLLFEKPDMSDDDQEIDSAELAKKRCIPNDLRKKLINLQNINNQVLVDDSVIDGITEINERMKKYNDSIHHDLEKLRRQKEIQTKDNYKTMNDFTVKNTNNIPIRLRNKVKYINQIKDFEQKIIHEWQYYDERKNQWKTVFAQPLQVIGGRAGGYRGYSYLIDPAYGSWRVLSKTENKQILGQKKFEVIAPVEAEKIQMKTVEL